MKNSIKKILIIRFGAIGDVIHSSGLFRSIKKYSNDLSIHYLCLKTPSLLIQNDPDLKKVWIAENKEYKYLYTLAKELKKEKFDLIINLQPSSRTNFLTFFSKAKKVLKYKKTFKLHAVENFWDTAKPVFKDLILDDKLHIYISEEVKEKVSTLISSDKKKILFNVGTSNTRQGRRWPIRYWQELAKILIDKYDCEIILTGSNEDKELANELLKISPFVKSFCAELPLVESAAIMSLCDLAISGDTGPLHIATAVNTRSIGIYGAAPVSRTGPYGMDNFAISSERNCVPCNKRKCRFVAKGKEEPCITDITPKRVFDLIDSHNLLSDI